MRRRSEEATRDAMHALAADTGGFLARSSNDLRSGLRAMLKDTETYYVLAYEPSNPKRDGAFRRVEVRLPGVRDDEGPDAVGVLRPRRAPPGGGEHDDGGGGTTGRAAPGGDAHCPPLARPARPRFPSGSPRTS